MYLYYFLYSNSLIVFLWREVMLMTQENGTMRSVLSPEGIYARRLVVSSVLVILKFVTQGLKLLFLFNML